MAKQKSNVDDIWGQLERNFGDDFLKSEEDILKEIEVIPTGSYALDSALTKWGLPMGRIVQFAGKESSGKSFMSLQVIKNWLEKAPHNWAYYIDAEFTYDKSWVKKLGIDDTRIKVLRSNSGIEVFTSLLGVPHKEIGKPKKKLGLLDIVKERGGAKESGLGVVVLDSIAVLQPPQEETSEVGKANMALMARFLPPELRKLVSLVSTTGVLFIAINQIRTNPGQLYGNPDDTTGGRALKHAHTVMINFGQLSGADNIMMRKDEQIGHKIRAKIHKDKMSGGLNRFCEFDIIYTKGIVNLEKEIVDLGTKYGVIARPNNRTYEYNGEKFVGKEAIGKYFTDKNKIDEILPKIKEAKDIYEKNDITNELPETILEDEEVVEG